MDELLAELGFAPIGQDTDHQNSETFSALYDDPLASLDDSSGSQLELRNAPSTAMDLNGVVNNIGFMVDKNYLLERDAPNQNHGVIDKMATSHTSMADFANANISIENDSSNCASVTSNETDYRSLDGIEYEYVIQPNHAQKEITYQVSQKFSILFLIIHYISFASKNVYFFNIIFRQRTPQICPFSVKQRKPPYMTKAIPQRR